METMVLINKLTPDIKGKAFDPDWFLLRQRLEEAERSISEAHALLREASELWTTSRAREERGVWDAEWDKRRVAFLATFVAEKATEAP